MNTFELLGEMGPRPCAESEATAFAMAAMQPGTTLSLLPFNQPELQPGEMRIEISHAGMCHSDVFMSTLGWTDEVFFPLVPGHEIAGVVTSLGPNVKGFDIGERVSFGVFRNACGKPSCILCATGKENLCPQKEGTYSPYFGGYATSFQARADYFTKIPGSIASEHAAPLMCAGLTTYSPLATYCKPGLKVGVQGIGGLGHLGIQFASRMGCEVTALSSSSTKQALAANLGAHHFLDCSVARQKQQARNSLDFLLITASAFKVSDFIDIVRPGGTICLVGLPKTGEDLGITTECVFTGKAIVGSSVGSLMEARAMMSFCELHNIRPQVEVHAFEHAQHAYDMLAHSTPRAPLFRNVLEMGSFWKTHKH